MGLIKDIEDVFNENKVKYFKGNNDTSNIINVIYRGIKNKENHINIYLDIDESSNCIRFIFTEKCNPSADLDMVKSQLLDLNATIPAGTLSMRNESDSIEYRADYIVAEDKFSFKTYNIFIVHCVKVYESLQEKEII